MSHNHPPQGSHETTKKKKLSKKQKLMGAGAIVTVAAAFVAGNSTGGGGGGNKIKTPQALEQVDLKKPESGQERFKQVLDSNEQHRLISSGIDAPTPEAALEELFNAMGHDYRILDVYAKLSGAYMGLGPEVQNNPDNAELLLTKDGKSLSDIGKSTLSFVEESLTGSINPADNNGVVGAPHTPEEVEKMIANGDASIEFIDLGDEIYGGPWYMTGMSKNGLVRSDQYNTFGDNTKAITINFPSLGNSDLPSEGGWSSVTVALSGGQPVLDNETQIDSIPQGHTEADGHQQTLPAY